VLLWLCAWLPAAWGQIGATVAEVKIDHRGPPAASDELIRAHIRVKAGDRYTAGAVDDDVRNLYATGFFMNIRVNAEPGPKGIVITYIVQGRPRVADIKFAGNKRYSDARLRKKLTTKKDEPLDERKLFTDEQEILKLYQKAGYPHTQVKAIPEIQEAVGHATVKFQITESPRVKIVRVDFVGAKAFSQRKLRGGAFVFGGVFKKTRKHWMFSWITSHGRLNDDDFDDDKERLIEFYHDAGFIDFEIKNVQFVNPAPGKLILRVVIYEGKQYTVGAVRFSGNELFRTGELVRGLRAANPPKVGKAGPRPNGLPMDVGATFTPKGFAADVKAVEDFYGARGYIDVSAGSGSLKVNRVPNTASGKMDLEFQIHEGQKSYMEKIQIRGNTKTKDKVIRRELDVSPGEVFDLVRVHRSQTRLEGMQYFSKVDVRPEPTEVPNRKDLIIAVEEGTTAHVSVGAGFNSIEGLVGVAEYHQGNFDIANPPRFDGGGQKLRLIVQLGLQKQDYLVSFTEPWFLGRKLRLRTDLYYRDLAYQSPNNMYDEIRAGGMVSLTRTLFNNESIIGGLSYTLEDVGIVLDNPYHGWVNQGLLGTAPPNPPGTIGGLLGPGGVAPNPRPNVPNAIVAEEGWHMLPRVGATLAYDTRGGGDLPMHGQRTGLGAQFIGGPLDFDKEYYKLSLDSSWYFKGLARGHVLELGAHTGVADSLKSGDVPFYDRYYLGGMWSLRGFRYRGVSPRQAGFNEPIGGDTFWFGSAEYSIPIVEQEHGVSLRFAVFYDLGSVAARPYTANWGGYLDNWGVGLRLNLFLAPIRLDYGIPIRHDIYNTASGQFQLGVGFTRDF
jgi:outer membrane protein insertion porin family